MEKNCRMCMRDLPFFDKVEQETFSPVCRRAAARKYFRRGETMFRQGDPSDGVYLIKEGSFKLVRVTEEGKEVILQLVSRGEVLGEAALFREGIHPATAVAMEDSRVCVVTRRSFEEIIRQSPGLAMEVIISLGSRLYETWEQVTELNAGNTKERVYNLLIRLASQHGEPCAEGTIIKIHLTQQDIADSVGASRVMVVHVLKELMEKNYIVRNDKYYILKDHCPLAERVK